MRMDPVEHLKKIVGANGDHYWSTDNIFGDFELIQDDDFELEGEI